MLINLITTKLLSEPLTECSRLAVGTKDIRWININGFFVLSNDVLKADLWIIEAFSQPQRPSGFLAAYKLAGQIKCLLLFSFVPPIFPKKHFWCDILTDRLVDRIREGIHKPKAQKVEFDQLIKAWPLLGYESAHHNHRITTR